MEENKDDRAVCSGCGTVAEDLPLTWSCQVSGGTRRHFCDACVREDLRVIETRLDPPGQ